MKKSQKNHEKSKNCSRVNNSAVENVSRDRRADERQAEYEKSRKKETREMHNAKKKTCEKGKTVTLWTKVAVQDGMHSYKRSIEIRGCSRMQVSRARVVFYYAKVWYTRLLFKLRDSFMPLVSYMRDSTMGCIHYDEYARSPQWPSYSRHHESYGNAVGPKSHLIFQSLQNYLSQIVCNRS